MLSYKKRFIYSILIFYIFIYLFIIIFFYFQNLYEHIVKAKFSYFVFAYVMAIDIFPPNAVNSSRLHALAPLCGRFRTLLIRSLHLAVAIIDLWQRKNRELKNRVSALGTG